MEYRRVLFRSDPCDRRQWPSRCRARAHVRDRRRPHRDRIPRHALIDRTRRRCAARALCLEQMTSARARLILWLVLMSLAGIWLWWAAGSRLQMETDITAMLPQTAPDEIGRAHV